MLKPILLSASLMLACAAVAAHEHHPPHKGTLIELGEEFAHLEVVLDSNKGALIVYVLDGEASEAVRLKQNEIELTFQGVEGLTTLSLKAQANVLTGEKEGDSSEFTAQSERLKGVKAFEAAVKEITVKSKVFTAVKISFPKGNEAGKE